MTSPYYWYDIRELPGFTSSVQLWLKDTSGAVSTIVIGHILRKYWFYTASGLEDFTPFVKDLKSMLVDQLGVPSDNISMKKEAKFHLHEGEEKPVLSLTYPFNYRGLKEFRSPGRTGTSFSLSGSEFRNVVNRHGLIAVGESYSIVELAKLQLRLGGPGWVSIKKGSVYPLSHCPYPCHEGELVPLPPSSRPLDATPPLFSLMLVEPDYTSPTFRMGYMCLPSLEDEKGREGVALSWQELADVGQTVDPDIVVSHDWGWLDLCPQIAFLGWLGRGWSRSLNTTLSFKNDNRWKSLHERASGRLFVSLHHLAKIWSPKMLDYSLLHLFLGTTVDFLDAIKVPAPRPSKVAMAKALLDRHKWIPKTRRLASLVNCSWSSVLTKAQYKWIEERLVQQFYEANCLLPEPAYGSEGYSGGGVPEADVGLHHKWAALLDFKKFYTSIMKEMNACFTTRLKPTSSSSSSSSSLTDPGPDAAPPPELLYQRMLDVEEEQYAKGEDPTSSALVKGKATIHDRAAAQLKFKPASEKAGILPSLISLFWDIGQRAVQRGDKEEAELAKLAGNEIYGILGCAVSRFYLPELAAYVTLKGRELLQLLKTTIEGTWEQWQPWHWSTRAGDTDGLSIQFECPSSSSSPLTDGQILTLIQAHLDLTFNVKFVHIRVMAQHIYKQMYLMKRKTFAAKLKGEAHEPWQIKGLPIVEHSVCRLTKRMAKAWLDFGFRRPTPDPTTEKDIETFFLGLLNTYLNVETLELEDFTIRQEFKEFSTAWNQPHGIVARTKNTQKYGSKSWQGEPCLNGDWIGFVYTKEGAKHPSDCEDLASIHLDWYLFHSIIPVTLRMLAPFHLSFALTSLHFQKWYSEFCGRVLADVPASLELIEPDISRAPIESAPPVEPEWFDLSID